MVDIALKPVLFSSLLFSSLLFSHEQEGLGLLRGQWDRRQDGDLEGQICRLYADHPQQDGCGPSAGGTPI
jgi:hypothetical protein